MYKPVPDRPVGRNEIRRYALRRDGAACRLCGFNECVEVHHIVPVSEGGSNDLSNVVTLCPNHHTMFHVGKVTREELLVLVR